MSELTPVLCTRVATRLARYGFPQCTAEKVQTVSEGGDLDDAALASAVFQELDELGFSAATESREKP